MPVILSEAQQANAHRVVAHVALDWLDAIRRGDSRSGCENVAEELTGLIGLGRLGHRLGGVVLRPGGLLLDDEEIDLLSAAALYLDGIAGSGQLDGFVDHDASAAEHWRVLREVAVLVLDSISETAPPAA